MDDIAELRALVERYATVVDARTFERLDTVFVADGVLVTDHGRRDGLAAIGAAMQGLHRYEHTDHRVGDTHFRADGDEATGTVECDAHHVAAEGGVRTDRIMTITYHDHYVRTPDGWRILERRLDTRRVETVELD